MNCNIVKLRTFTDDLDINASGFTRINYDALLEFKDEELQGTIISTELFEFYNKHINICM